MSVLSLASVSQVSDILNERHGGKRVPDWKIRRVVDALCGSGVITVQRFRGYRVIDASGIEAVAAELHRSGWLPTYAAASSIDPAVAVAG